MMQAPRKIQRPAKRLPFPWRGHETSTDAVGPTAGRTRIGEMEFDLIAHCGTEPTGRFVSTLVLTDCLSGWTECAPVLVESAGQIVEALERLWWTMPFSLIGLDAENVDGFARKGLTEFCGRYGIRQSGASLYDPGEQAWVAPRNGALIRRMVGFGRLEGRSAVQTLARLYARTRLFVNFVQPSFRCDTNPPHFTPATPASRLVAAHEIPAELKVRLKVVEASLDPLSLHDHIRALQSKVIALAKIGPTVRSLSTVAQRRRSSGVDCAAGPDGPTSCVADPRTESPFAAIQ